MRQFFRNRFLSLFKNKRDYCLVIEKNEGVFEATWAKLDYQHKAISIFKKKKIKDLKKLKKPMFLFDKMVLALNSGQATTIESVVHLKRSRGEEVINEAELDHLIFRGLWEFLNHYRSWVAKKMNVADMDLVLANIEIKDVGLGTHRVFNPIGFKGSDFFLRFQGTFISRELFNSLSFLNRWAKKFYIVESQAITAASVPEPKDFVVEVGESKTSVFVFYEEEALYYKENGWGLNNILTVLAKAFALDRETAELILNRYLEKKLSVKTERGIERMINQEFTVLSEILANFYNKAKGNKARPIVYFNFRFALRPPDSFLSNQRFHLVNFSKWLELEGFEINLKKLKHFHSGSSQVALALLTHPYNYPQYEFLNQLLHRRAKWLSVNI